MGGIESHGRADEHESIGAGGQICTGTTVGRPGSETDGGTLRLQLKTVQERKAILQQELRQLDETEIELRRLLADWETRAQRQAGA